MREPATKHGSRWIVHAILISSLRDIKSARLHSSQKKGRLTMRTQTISRPYCESRLAIFGRRPGQQRAASKFKPPHCPGALRGLLMAGALAMPFWLTLIVTVIFLSR